MLPIFGKIKTFIIPISIIVAAVLVVGAFLYLDQSKIKILSAKEVGDLVIKYIKTNVNGGDTATLTSIVQEGDIYKLQLSINGKTYDSYASRDGKLLFPSGYSLAEATSTAQTESGNSTSTNTQIPKADKPDVELFVMGFCPYGNQAEDTMLSVYNLLKDKVNWNIHYIVSVDNGTVSSLHGQKEVTEDQREVCVLQKSGMNKWWQFVTYVNDNCGSDGSCWQAAAGKAGADVSAINDCVSSDSLSLLKTEAATANAAGVSGSPTLIINGVKSDSVYQYGNSQAYLNAICSGFNVSPGECSQPLASQSAGVSNGGSCAQ